MIKLVCDIDLQSIRKKNKAVNGYRTKKIVEQTF